MPAKAAEGAEPMPNVANDKKDMKLSVVVLITNGAYKLNDPKILFLRKSSYFVGLLLQKSEFE